MNSNYLRLNLPQWESTQIVGYNVVPWDSGTGRQSREYLYGVIFHLFQEILTKKNKRLRQRLAEAETETSHWRNIKT